MAAPAPVRVLVTNGAADTVRKFLDGPGAAAADWLSVTDYRTARREPEIAPGAWVFADLDRMSVDQSFHAGRFRERLAAHAGVRRLNDPVHTRRRFELLRRLYDRGSNPIGVWRVEDRRVPARWPVFVRMEHLPLLSSGALIRDPTDLARTVAQMDAAGQYRPSLLLVERPDGVPGPDESFGVLRIGDALLVERSPWGAEAPALDAANVRRLRAVFDLARIQYGRLAVAFSGTDPVVWDADTNPSLVQVAARCAPGALLAALEALRKPA